MDSLKAQEQNLLEALSESLTQAPVATVSPALARHDFSLLSSAWQKAIRRSDAGLASRCGLELHRRDPDYFWRRIRIVVLEDISVGSLEVSGSVLAIAGKRVLQRRLGDHQLASHLSAELAGARKSRTACDLACLLPLDTFATQFPAVDVSLRVFDRPKLMALATAWRQTAAYSAQVAGRWRTISRGNPGLRDEYLDAIDAPTVIRFIAVRGAGTEALNALLVPAYQLMVAGHSIPEPIPPAPASWDLIGGLPAYAYCMYSAPGMQAISEFLKRTPWGRRLQALRVRNPKKALGHLIFYTEGGHLTRPLEVLHAAAIREWSEEVSLGRFGIPPDQIAQLKSDLASDLPQLNAFRRQVNVRTVS